MRLFRIAVDFDGTIVDHRFPEIGAAVFGALDWLRKWSKEPRIELMLWTMRSNGQDGRNYLFEAVEWCHERGVYFAHVNHAPQEWTSSPKLFADVYIDDAAAGVPVLHPCDFKRPVVDWREIGPLVQRQFETFVSRPQSAVNVPGTKTA